MNKLKLLLIIYIILIILSQKRYIIYYPTIPIYKNNNNESNIVKKLSDNRTQEDIDFFYLTNRSIIYAYLPYVKESKNELLSITESKKIYNILLFLKYLINRARPYQINDKINYIYTNTGLTPSYPAGHALQAYYLTSILEKRYPEKKKLFNDLAEKCNDCRIKAGIHYPSDGEFSKYLIKYI